MGTIISQDWSQIFAKIVGPKGRVPFFYLTFRALYWCFADFLRCKRNLRNPWKHYWNNDRKMVAVHNWAFIDPLSSFICRKGTWSRWFELSHRWSQTRSVQSSNFTEKNTKLNVLSVIILHYDHLLILNIMSDNWLLEETRCCLCYRIYIFSSKIFCSLKRN